MIEYIKSLFGASMKSRVRDIEIRVDALERHTGLADAFEEMGRALNGD